MRQDIIQTDIGTSRTAFRLVLLIGSLSFFADFTYEGSPSVLGPFLASLQTSGTVVGLITGFGELLGYGLRLASGRLADATGRFCPITIFGYVVQMAAVPALALVDCWPAFDRSRACRQGDPQSAARRNALSRRKAARRAGLGVWSP